MGNKISKRNRIELFNGNYIIRVDDLQIDRIQVLHHILKACCDGNFFAPISEDLLNGIQVLDVGSGPGTWMFDMSSDFPMSEFMGIEMQSYMLPTVHPSNTKFINNDILQGIPLPQHKFDYIHMRCMTLCFTEQQYEQVIRELVGLLKPNGYLELCEPEMCSKNMGPISERISSEMGKFLRSRSMNPFINEHLGELMNRFGLQEVHDDHVDLPISELDGRVGALYGQSLYEGLVGLKRILSKQMHLADSEMDELLDAYRHETKTRRMYVRYTRVYGRKLVKS